GLPAAAGITGQAGVAGAPATQAGVRVGDIITRVNDQQIDQQHPLTSIMVKTRPGDRVKLTIIRGGETSIVEVTLGRQP
ncbi:MAG: PDZ domain-containing protein, partial [Chloroflexota bacterium]